jgi:hypothetical protein
MKNYYVGTNDYLANGGDDFLAKVSILDLDYIKKHLIDYFKAV